jgi:regulator of sigma E protease
MNLLLAIFVFWGANYFKGKPVTETTTVGYVEESSTADSLGFISGDKITSVNNEKVTNWEDLRTALYINTIGDDLNIVVDRNGRTENLFIPRSRIPDLEKQGEFILPEGLRPYVNAVDDGSPAEKAGIKAGDIFLSINNADLASYIQLIKVISANAGNELSAVIKRGEDTLAINVIPAEDGKIGIAITETFEGKIEYRTFGFFESFYLAGADMVNYTKLTFRVAKKVIIGEVEFGKAFGGPVRIAQLAAKSADVGIEGFLFFLAILSLSLALINIMPFPVLDGGHLLIIIIETIARREIPVKVKIAINNTGFVLLLLLMAFIIYNDILSL